jgi:7,8-dihydroneopterin aldolase/epimerase/oxygenase
VDAIRLSGMSFYGYHGVEPEERRLGQRFIVDLGLELDLRPAGHSDDLDETVNYADVWRAARAVVEGPPVRLIERLGELLAARLLADFPAVRAVRVRVEKPWAPIPGAQLASVAVEICRGRDGPTAPPTSAS